MSPSPECIALVDVYYNAANARAACVLAHSWNSPAPFSEWTVDIESVRDYRPGLFFERELPCILAALQASPIEPDLIVVDGYAVLDAHGRPGLGARLFEQLGKRIPVVGIAKRSFAGSDFAQQVYRGSSKVPIYVTAIGMRDQEAAQQVQTMHGPYRIPTLCARVDQIPRGL
jgi:deoxyribonuclease V